MATLHPSPLISLAHRGFSVDEGVSTPPSASQRLRESSKVETRASPSQEGLQSLEGPCVVGPSQGSGLSWVQTLLHSHSKLGR